MDPNISLKNEVGCDMQQICCSMQQSKFFFNKHAIWLSYTCKIVLVPKFSSFVHNLNPPPHSAWISILGPPLGHKRGWSDEHPFWFSSHGLRYTGKKHDTFLIPT